MDNQNLRSRIRGVLLGRLTLNHCHQFLKRFDACGCAFGTGNPFVEPTEHPVTSTLHMFFDAPMTIARHSVLLGQANQMVVNRLVASEMWPCIRYYV
jgi:hypothetical protein